MTFVDDRAGGICHNEGEPCKDEKHGMCIDGCCICNSGYSVVGGSCTQGMLTLNIGEHLMLSILGLNL